MEILIVGFVLGFLGSLHCIGMCGPIAFALPLKNSSVGYRIVGALTYNFGRIVTYSLLGFVFGFFGQGIKTASSQQFLSILIGSILILGVLIPSKWLNNLSPTSFVYQQIAFVKQKLGALLKSSSLHNLWFIGFLNGFLPCGLVYTAIGSAIALGDVYKSIWFMAAFGLGTLPLMFLATQLASVVSVSIRNKIRKFFPILIIIIGVLFILRGLNLNIPYISPKINVERPFVQDC